MASQSRSIFEKYVHMNAVKETAPMEWYNKPPFYDISSLDNIRVTAASKTGFWRKTQGNVIRDNGHFLYRPVDGDFAVSVKVTPRFLKQYDQAGLMLRSDETTWAKCGMELVGGNPHINVVVTRDFSDLSLIALPLYTKAVWLCMSRKGLDLEVSYSFDGEKFTLLRAADFTDKATLQAGIMAASPDGDGFPAAFEALTFRNLK